MSAAARPTFSYVVPCDSWPTIAEVAEALGRQTIAGEIELVVVGPSPERLRAPAGAASRLAGVVVAESPLLPLGAARARGVLTARASVVVLGETHVFPAASWAEELVAALASGVAAVAPRIVLAGREGALSWTALAMDYGRWQNDGAGPIDVAPSYNAAWRRDVLIDHADDLALLLTPGGDLSGVLRRQGYRLERCGRAELAHLNVDRPVHWLAERFVGGRLVAADRSRSWSRLRRFAYAAVSPLIAAVIERRTLAAMRGFARPPGALLALTAGSITWAAGEAVGYVVGSGRAEARMLEYELHKRRYVRGAP